MPVVFEQAYLDMGRGFMVFGLGFRALRNLCRKFRLARMANNDRRPTEKGSLPSITSNTMLYTTGSCALSEVHSRVNFTAKIVSWVSS